MILLSLDLSTKCSGYSVFTDDKLTDYGSFAEGKYKHKSLDRYPAKSAKVGKIMAEKVMELVSEVKPDKIVIEEISVGGKQGVLQVKSLAAFHGMLMYLLHDQIDIVYFMPASGKLKSHGIELPGWRKILQLKKNGDWKASSVKRANEIYGLNLEYADDDIADSILIGTAFLELGIE